MWATELLRLLLALRLLFLFTLPATEYANEPPLHISETQRMRAAAGAPDAKRLFLRESESLACHFMFAALVAFHWRQDGCQVGSRLISPYRPHVEDVKAIVDGRETNRVP